MRFTKKEFIDGETAYMEKLATYKNGNTLTTIYDDGTKTHFTKEDDFRFEFPECHDITISQCCDNGCPFCYYGCTPSGKHGKLIGWNFFDTMRPYTEIAINLQYPLHPQLIQFLEEMKERKIIVNATINQSHFMRDCTYPGTNERLIYGLVKRGLVNGIGISLTNPTQSGFVEAVQKYPNAVIHVIAGILNPEDLAPLMNKGLKLLILGYKTTGRGTDYFFSHTMSVSDNIRWLSSSLDEVVESFKVVSFDNLALEQLDVKSSITDEEWNLMYAGEDGTNTFAIDLVNGTFSRNSVSHIHYTIGDKTIDEMFKIVRSEVKRG